MAVPRSLQLILAALSFAAIAVIAGCGGGGSAGPGSVLPNPPGQSAQAPVSSSAELIYVANFASITAYPSSANGDVSPTLFITGGNTLLSGPDDVAVDSHGNIYVSNSANVGCIASINVYAPGSTGNVAPIRTISGPHTGLTTGGGIAIDRFDNVYEVSHGGPVSAPDVAVLEFAPGASGDATPIRKISGDRTQLVDPFAITVDASGKIYVVNSLTQNASVAIYAANANGNVPPVALIQGDQTRLIDPLGIALDSAGNIYVANPVSGTSPQNGSVTIYAAGSNGNVAPSGVIGGPTSTLFRPEGVAVDSAGNIFVSDEGTNGQPASIDVFAPITPPGVGPIQTITGPSTQINQPELITVH